MDVDRIREALRVWDSWRKLVTRRFPKAYDDGPLAVQAVLAEAARLVVEAPTQSCEQCEGGGDVLPHGDVDCDVCVRGEYEGHTVECPTCGGVGEVLAVRLLVPPKEKT